MILAGLKIVDLTQGLAGPVATRLLAESGADVVKVEPSNGDWARRDCPAGFATWNRSKSSIVADLRASDGRAVLRTLLDDADVVVHDLTPSEAARLELDDATLGWRHPRLIVAGLSGYPVNHPDANRANDEMLVQARLGAMGEQQGNREGPVFIRMPFASWCAALLLACGIVTRLIHREKTGQVGPIHTSLLQGALVPASLYWHRAERSPGWFLRRDKIRKVDSIPQLMQFRCADGLWLQLIGGWAEVPPVLEALAELDLVHLIDEELTSENVASWARVFDRRTAAEWEAELSATDVPCAVIRTIGELFLDEQTLVNGYSLEVADSVLGDVIQAGLPFQTEPRCEIRSSAPCLGEARRDAPKRPTDAFTMAESALTAAVGTEPLLQGFRVLDFGIWVAAPFAAQLLADLGAEVIKVEPPRGDPGRGSNQFFGCQRGKRSLALDLTASESRPILESLVQWADVAIHNLRPRPARRLGVDAASLRALNPRIVVGEFSSNGPLGPRSELPGYDPIAQASSGWSAAVSGQGNRPTWLRNSVLDPLGGLDLLCGVLLALYHRCRTGEAGQVSASLLGAAALTCSETVVPTSDLRPLPVRCLDAEQTGIAPGYRIYECLDGWMAVVAATEESLEVLRAVAGTNVDRDIQSRIRFRLLRVLADELATAGLEHEIVNVDAMDAFFDSAANRDARLSVTYDTPEYGRFDQIGEFWHFPDHVQTLTRPVPSLGEHSRELLGSFGMDDHAIQDLLDRSIVGEWSASGGPTTPTSMTP